MSHTTTIDVDFKDLDALREAVEASEGEWLGARNVRLYDGTQIDAAAAFQPRGWRYPVAVADGKLSYDNYEGVWGDEAQLSAIRQRYSRNVTVKRLRARGYRVEEKQVGKRIRITATRR